MQKGLEYNVKFFLTDNVPAYQDQAFALMSPIPVTTAGEIIIFRFSNAEVFSLSSSFKPLGYNLRSFDFPVICLRQKSEIQFSSSFHTK